MPLEKWWLSKSINGAWEVMLYRRGTASGGMWRFPIKAAEAVLAVPPMSESYFFWSGNGRPETAVRAGGEAWSRSMMRRN